MFKDEIAQLRRSGVRHLLTQALSTALVLSTALMMWKGLSVICNTESPVVVVLSESMEPAIQRGDLLFLTMPRSAPLHHGDITVYKVPGAPVPIVHRVIETHDEKNSSEQWILTKGDNNQADDVGLYNGMRYLRRSHIVGKVQGYIPYVGYGTILMDSLRTCLLSRGQNCAALQELVRAPTSSLAALSRGGGGGGIPRKYTGGR